MIGKLPAFIVGFGLAVGVGFVGGSAYAAPMGAVPSVGGESAVIDIRRGGRGGFRGGGRGGFRGGGRAFRGGGFRGRSIRGGGFRGRVYRGPRRSFRRFRRYRGPRVYFYSPAYVPYGYYHYRSYRRCAWLRRRAIRTGSRYWWRRYRRCVRRYYY